MQKQALTLLKILMQQYPNAKMELGWDFKDPWRLLVLVVLSAQTTDKKVNEIAPALFGAFPSISYMAQADAKEVEPYIKTLGFFRQKAKNLVKSAQQIIENHQGQVPKTEEELVNLAGVGPKTAAVILSNAFGVPAIAVDTHVGRLARRMGLSSSQDPNHVQKDLCALFPKRLWSQSHHVLIWHGRRLCKAQKPKCDLCPVQKKCPRVGVEK